MSSSEIYNEYASLLRELSQLDIDRRELPADEPVTSRVRLEESIRRTRQKLDAIMEQMIYSNPFLNNGYSGSRKSLSGTLW